MLLKHLGFMSTDLNLTIYFKVHKYIIVFNNKVPAPSTSLGKEPYIVRRLQITYCTFFSLSIGTPP